MAKYDYNKMGHRTYEQFKQAWNCDLPIPSEEEYYERTNKEIALLVRVTKFNRMMRILKDIRISDYDLMDKIYEVVAPVLDLPTDEEELIEAYANEPKDYRIMEKEEKLHERAIKDYLDVTPLGSTYEDFKRRTEDFKFRKRK